MKKTYQKGQFRRYRDWVEKGATLKPKQIREVTVYVNNSQPNFHAIIDKQTLDALGDSIAKHNPDATVLQVSSRKFSLNELQKLTRDSYKKLGELKKLNPEVSFTELANQYFDRKLCNFLEEPLVPRRDKRIKSEVLKAEIRQLEYILSLPMTDAFRQWIEGTMRAEKEALAAWN